MGNKFSHIDELLYPVTIIATRYQGGYEGGRWAAFNTFPYDLERRCNEWADLIDPDGEGCWYAGDDLECAEWWASPPPWVAVGNTPDEALEALYVRFRAEVPASERAR